MQLEATAEFNEWLDRLPDAAGRRKILMRVRRLAEGNPGTHRYIGAGVLELKINRGPGYRVYYMHRSKGFIVLLLGGDKHSQRRDIVRAITASRQVKGER